MSDLSSFIAAAGGVSSIQTGYVSGAASASTGEDTEYFDVTISAVDVNKAVPMFVGGNGSTAANAMALTGASTLSYQCTARLTSSTNLRIASAGALGTIAGRWTVVEFN